MQARREVGRLAHDVAFLGFACAHKLTDYDQPGGLTDPEAKQRLNKIGLDVHTSTPEAMRAMVAEQIANWKKVVADAGIPQQ